MKIKQVYMTMLMVFFLVIMATLIMQYPYFRFQLYRLNDYEAETFQAENEDMTITDYYASDHPYYGGASVYLKDEKEQFDSLNATVTLNNGQTIQHRLTHCEGERYMMDAVLMNNTAAKPEQIAIFHQDQLVASADLTAQTGTLYQASSHQYVFRDIFVTASGVFTGLFEAYEKEALLEQFQMVTVEFCHPDASKSSGYQLLARTQYQVPDFLANDASDFIPFLPSAKYQSDHKVEVIITFEGANRQTIVLTLKEGVSR